MSEDKINLINWNDLVHYDETSPTCLRWKVNIMSGSRRNVQSTHVGRVAGSLGPFYCTISHKGKTHFCHRVIWFMHFGKLQSNLYIDHIDGNKHNNQLKNLRLVTNKVNQQNQKMNSRNTSGVAGVSFCNDKAWVASWFDADNIRHRKTFNIFKYGFDAAFNMACEHREKMIEWLNLNGCNYTDRHGKNLLSN